MNQTLKDSVYTLGTDRHVDAIAAHGGMTAEEKQMFLYFHRGEKDTYVMSKMSLDEKPFKALEKKVRKKFLVGLFRLLDYAIDNIDK